MRNMMKRLSTRTKVEMAVLAGYVAYMVAMIELIKLIHT